MVDKPLANTLREMILQGRLAPGERVTETALAERLGISRTPIRGLLPALAAEGLLSPVGRRGYAVARFSERESVQALELRALLEGQAARMVAREGAAPALLSELRSCLAEGDALFASGRLEAADRDAYGAMNARFHMAVVEGAGSGVLLAMLERLNTVPFVAPANPVFDRVHAPAMFTLLHRAHGHHHAITEAIEAQDPARAEMLFREHALMQRQSMFEGRRPSKDSDAPRYPSSCDEAGWRLLMALP